jgi:hypothetical protein
MSGKMKSATVPELVAAAAAIVPALTHSPSALIVESQKKAATSADRHHPGS